MIYGNHISQEYVGQEQDNTIFFYNYRTRNIHKIADKIKNIES